MQEASPSTPQGGGSSFDLEASDADGSGRGVTLEGGALGWTSAGVPRRRGFGDIVAVELESDRGGEEPSGRCDILFADGAQLSVWIVSDANHSRETVLYREFVFGFIEQLGPGQRARIVFRHGLRPGTRMQHIVMSSICLVGVLGVFVYALASQAALKEDNAWLALPLLLLFAGMLAGILRGALKSSRNIFDPQAVPESALPPAPKQRARREQGD